MTLIKSLVLGLLLATGASWAGTLDLNTADAKALEEMKGVGPAKAQAIVEYRNQNGPFKSVDDLAKVPGIKVATIDKNRDLVTVGSPAAPAKPAKAERSAKKDTK